MNLQSYNPVRNTTHNTTLNAGFSLPLVIGLVAVLMAASAAAGSLVIRNLKSTGQIEAAARAYLAAEGGIEDGLYELSSHFAGYETPDLNEDTVRTVDFGNRVRDVWTIRSHEMSNAPQGKFLPDDKLTISLFNDEGVTDSAVIDTLNVANDFAITFTVPGAFSALPTFHGLVIDNDRDGPINGTNEDGPQDNDPTCFRNTADADCDGRVNEDSPEDPVIYWKLYDDAGNILTPISGCLSDNKSEICEKDFNPNTATPFSAALTQDTIGENQSGQQISINTFISQIVTANQHAKLVMEFMLVAPLEDATDPFNKITVTHLGYSISYNGSSMSLPDPYFTIKSDGYDRDFKQSITAKIKPRALVPLFDFTILQQE